MEYFVRLSVCMAGYMSVSFCILWMHKLYMYTCMSVILCGNRCTQQLYWHIFYNCVVFVIVNKRKCPTHNNNKDWTRSSQWYKADQDWTRSSWWCEVDQEWTGSSQWYKSWPRVTRSSRWYKADQGLTRCSQSYKVGREWTRCSVLQSWPWVDGFTVMQNLIKTEREVYINIKLIKTEHQVILIQSWTRLNEDLEFATSSRWSRLNKSLRWNKAD